MFLLFQGGIFSPFWFLGDVHGMSLAVDGCGMGGPWQTLQVCGGLGWCSSMLGNLALKRKLPCQTICQFSSQKNSLPLAEWTREPVSTSYMVYLKTKKPKSWKLYPPSELLFKSHYGGPPRLKLRRTTWVWHFVPGFPTTSTTCQNTRVKQGPTRKTLMRFIGR